MRRSVGVFSIFLVGIAVGWFLFTWRSERPAPDSLAQARAVRLLSQPLPTTEVGENRVVQATRKIEPAVVNIDTIDERGQSDDLGFGSREVRGKGSGVILTPDGYIVTNHHVIEGADRVRVTLANGRWHYAQLVGSDPKTDLAVLRIKATNLPVAEFADADKLAVGEWAIAIGNPLGLGSSITVGVISALNRRNLQIDDHRVLDGAIQTDAAINRGNSGGALANINGQVVGVNTAILSSGPQGGSIGLGFAIPSNVVRQVAKEIIQTGRATPRPNHIPFMGVRYGIVPEKTAKEFNLDAHQGAMLYEIVPGGPAAKAGLQVGDILLSIDEKMIGDQKDVLEAVRQRKSGEAVHLQVLRPSIHKERSFNLRLQEFPDTTRFKP